MRKRIQELTINNGSRKHPAKSSTAVYGFQMYLLCVAPNLLTSPALAGQVVLKKLSFKTACYYKGLTQIFRKLIGSLGSPCDWSLMGAAPCFLYDGWPIQTVSPFRATLFCINTPL